MSDRFVHSVALMGTIVSIEVVGHGETRERATTRRAAVDRAMAWFHQVEETCSRFIDHSEARRLAAHVGEAVPVSVLLLEAVRYALALAEESDGAFDPTVGQAMEARGFDREYRTGRVVRAGVAADASVNYRDVLVDADRRSITLRRPLVLDLGAVAKGLAVDLAARELQPFEHFMIDGGGDMYAGGCNAAGEPWSIGIRHPRQPGALIGTVRVSNAAICTSGDYERVAREGGDAGNPAAAAPHHIVDARTGATATSLASVTVIAPTCMAADGLATAAFALGRTDGLRLLERHHVDALIITTSGEQFTTPGMRARDYHTIESPGAAVER